LHTNIHTCSTSELTQMTDIYAKCFANDLSTRWQFSKAAAFTFSIVTVLGFGSVQAVSRSGKVCICVRHAIVKLKIFYLVYASIGIPLVMVVLANLGKYVVNAITNLQTIAAHKYVVQRKKWQLRHAKHVNMMNGKCVRF
jgi:hypothetical protein